MIFEKVRDLIAEKLSISKDKISLESDLIDELEADSLDIVQMLISLETEFDLEFDDEEIGSLKTVSDVVSFIEKKN